MSKIGLFVNFRRSLQVFANSRIFFFWKKAWKVFDDCNTDIVGRKNLLGCSKLWNPQKTHSHSQKPGNGENNKSIEILVPILSIPGNSVMGILTEGCYGMWFFRDPDPGILGFLCQKIPFMQIENSAIF